MKNLFTKIALVSALVFFILPINSRAAEINLNIGSSAYDLQDTFMVDLYIDTESSSVNALEAEINFDADLLKVIETIDSDSTVNFWIEKNVSSGMITLSGIIPGGFNGESGKILTILFETVASGQARIELQEAAAFLSDGLGTREDILGKQIDVEISKKVSQNIQNKNLYSSDKYPPESFKPEISRSESLFDNEWFLVFSTSDKNSGVSHYLIKEARYRALMFFKRWRVVESPYVLRDQSRASFVAIKAVDKAGNEMIQKVYPENEKTVSERILVVVVVTLLGLIFLALLKWIIGRMSRYGDN